MSVLDVILAETAIPAICLLLYALAQDLLNSLRERQPVSVVTVKHRQEPWRLNSGSSDCRKKIEYEPGLRSKTRVA
jgi:hypothetical protein